MTNTRTGHPDPHNQRQLPKPSELAPLLRLQRPTVRPQQRRLRRATDIWDLRAAARKVAPRAVFDYAEGGADEEVSINAIREQYRRVEFHPRVLRDVSTVDPTTEILGTSATLPMVYAPTGYTRMMHHEGEIAVGRAAAELGIPYALSTVGTTSPEDLSASCPGADLWFQLYMWTDRDESRRLVQRAWDAGFSTLVLTVDTAVAGNRQRDTRNGLDIPPRLTLSTVADMARHPRWWVNKLTTPAMRFACVPDSWGADEVDMAGTMFDTSVNDHDLAWIRSIWPGKLVVKGVQTLADAKWITQHGVDGLVLSNHGGRQMDRAHSVLTLLPEVVQACGDQVSVLIDSGIVRGADVLAAVAAGARGVLVGRAYLYGLMAGGEPGVRRAGEILDSEIRRSMALLGARDVTELTPDLVSLPRT